MFLFYSIIYGLRFTPPLFFFFCSRSSNCHLHTLSLSCFLCHLSICICRSRYRECYLTMPALKAPQIKYVVTGTLTQATECLCDFSASISVSRARRSKRHIWTFSGWWRIVTVIIKTVKVKLWFIECAACVCFHVCQWYIRIWLFSCFQEHGHANELNMLSRNRSFSESLTLFMITPF